MCLGRGGGIDVHSFSQEGGEGERRKQRNWIKKDKKLRELKSTTRKYFKICFNYCITVISGSCHVPGLLLGNYRAICTVNILTIQGKTERYALLNESSSSKIYVAKLVEVKIK